MVCTRTKGREGSLLRDGRGRRWQSHHTLPDDGKLGREARIGTSKCEQCLYKCNTEVPQSVNTGRGVALLDELYNEMG
ncbi:hypothetical protein L207DRAFT_193726 [Hyaloscypha variabilis F]|uniref:Uncharacterized protein n=1 Tax=Hyaloscypha variabilis (strain UAMH 11265 / GT02V1 / F) TaxID=1149755 RepID=A0A2J6QYB2_HYAVF|nr:hypothetical protein L207DRAFT_193726 [Hyaloscypha variabilis F]